MCKINNVLCAVFATIPTAGHGVTSAVPNLGVITPQGVKLDFLRVKDKTNFFFYCMYYALLLTLHRSCVLRLRYSNSI